MAGGFGLGGVVAQGAGNEFGDAHIYAVASVGQGLTTSMPLSRKSLLFRVATAMPCDSAIAAI
jgi:hypothetical protein